VGDVSGVEGAPLGRLRYVCLQPLVDGDATATHVAAVVGGLRRRGWHIELVAPLRSATPSPAHRVLGWCRGVMQSAKALRELDVLYLRTHVAAWPLAALARRRGVPVVEELNGGWGEVALVRPWARRLTALVRLSFTRQLRSAALVIAVTPELAAAATAAGAPQVVAISNGADTERFRPGIGRPDGAPDCFVLFFGALSQWQGVETLLAATQHPRWPGAVDLVVIGQGALEDAVRAAASRSASIHYLGRLAHDELPPWVAAALATAILKQGAVSSSGFSPLKLYESMACATATIVTDVPGLADTVRATSCGIVVDAPEPAAVAAAVAELAADPNRARSMGEAGRAAAVRDHSWDAVAAQTDDWLRRV
jgi:glycosyltransferase involved in cell wall biosynthesis